MKTEQNLPADAGTDSEKEHQSGNRENKSQLSSHKNSEPNVTDENKRDLQRNASKEEPMVSPKVDVIIECTTSAHNAVPSTPAYHQTVPPPAASSNSIWSGKADPELIVGVVEPQVRLIALKQTSSPEDKAMDLTAKKAKAVATIILPVDGSKTAVDSDSIMDLSMKAKYLPLALTNKGKSEIDCKSECEDGSVSTEAPLNFSRTKDICYKRSGSTESTDTSVKNDCEIIPHKKPKVHSGNAATQPQWYKSPITESLPPFPSVPCQPPPAHMKTAADFRLSQGVSQSSSCTSYTSDAKSRLANIKVAHRPQSHGICAPHIPIPQQHYHSNHPLTNLPPLTQPLPVKPASAPPKPAVLGSMTNHSASQNKARHQRMSEEQNAQKIMNLSSKPQEQRRWSGSSSSSHDRLEKSPNVTITKYGCVPQNPSGYYTSPVGKLPGSYPNMGVSKPV